MSTSGNPDASLNINQFLSNKAVERSVSVRAHPSGFPRRTIRRSCEIRRAPRIGTVFPNPHCKGLNTTYKLVSVERRRFVITPLDARKPL